MSTIVYSANFGNYDLVKAPVREPGMRYIMFSDRKQEGWETHIEKVVGDPRRFSRWFKMSPHLCLPRHTWSVWVDSSIGLTRALRPLLESIDTQLAAYAHPSDDCVFKHALRVKRLGLEFPLVVDEQMKRYREAGMPLGFGLTENAVLFRKDTTAQQKLSQLWWEEYMLGSRRDQLSLPFCLWKLKIPYTILPGSARDYEGWGQHLGKREVL